MESTMSRKRGQWPRKVKLGRVSVSVYRRATPTGGPGFMVANYATGKRRFDSYPTEEEAWNQATYHRRFECESTDADSGTIERGRTKCRLAASFNEFRQRTKFLVVLLPRNTQRGSSECFGILRRGKIAVIDEHKLVKDEVRNSLQLRHEHWMDVHFEARVRSLPIRDWEREFTRLQGGCIENDFARVANEHTILKQSFQFRPAEGRAIFFVDFHAFDCDVSGKRLAGIIHGKLRGHVG